MLPLGSAIPGISVLQRIQFENLMYCFNVHVFLLCNDIQKAKLTYNVQQK